MKNIPRIYLNEHLDVGKNISAPRDIVHYLTKVMRTDECLVFNNGLEYSAKLSDDRLSLFVSHLTKHSEPSNDITLYFAPIKKTDELINMATQMGVAKFVPVITERTNAHHINWERMKKIATEASEQSGRNSVPIIEPPIKFSEMCNLQSEKCNLIFADERTVNDNITNNCTLHFANCALLIGPEGGFADSEFCALDKIGATGISLGKTILRAEVAAIVALAKLTPNH